jgi:hypothetical protein
VKLTGACLILFDGSENEWVSDDFDRPDRMEQPNKEFQRQKTTGIAPQHTPVPGL